MLGLIRSGADNKLIVGTMAAMFDETELREPEGLSERVLTETWKSAKATADKPLHMARSAPWDYLEPKANSDAATFLQDLLAAPWQEDSAANDAFLRGAPEGMCFIRRLLPGVVERHDWDHHPTNAISWDVLFPDGADEAIPHVELARAHIGDNPRDDAVEQVRGSTAEDYQTNGDYQPVTTKAGGRLWSISFVAPPNCNSAISSPTAKGLRAAYPMQLLVRFDRGRQTLIYDAFEFSPTTATAFDADAKAGDPVSVQELHQIERILKQKKRKLTAMMGDEMPREPDAEQHSARWKQHGVQKLYPLAEWLRFKTSHVRRARFPVAAICGARLLIIDKPPPHGDLPPARGDMSVASLGQVGPDSGSDNMRALSGSFAARGPELEPLGLLIFELSQCGAHIVAAFAHTRVWSTHRANRRRKQCEDWTPDGVFSRARRHYILGDASEIVELSKALSEAFPHIAQLLRGSSAVADHEDQIHVPPLKVAATFTEMSRRHKNTLARDLVDPSKTTWVRTLANLAATRFEALSAPEMSREEQGSEKHGQTSTSSSPFRTCKDVHDFLRRAGIANPEEVNPCLCAGLLNGGVPVPALLAKAADASPFLDELLLTAGCMCCGKKMQCTVRQALYQEPLGTDYGDGGEGAAVQCRSKEFGVRCGGNYISGLCTRTPHFDSGKGHNHCTQCPNFGTCIGDYREDHCHRCGDHFFAGSSGRYPCPCRGKDMDDVSYYGGDSDDCSDGSSDSGSEDSLQEPGNLHGVVPLPRDGCWDGSLRGVSIAAMKDQL
ncbi:unnamed protein product [Polarella glacialis]|uniref:Uncharacterized protein n=1 Tax=Polarella glacialis TaxID=89957 RepID=A0A813GW02_POLGL|nr:unnamed protein product [Polarella glacialis]